MGLANRSRLVRAAAIALCATGGSCSPAVAGEVPIGDPPGPRVDCPRTSAICHADNYVVTDAPGANSSNSVRYTARSATYRGGSTERMFSSFGVGAHPAWSGIDGYRASIDVSGTYAPLFTPFACIMPEGAQAAERLCDGGFVASQQSPRTFSVTVADHARRIRVGWNFAPTTVETIHGGQTMTAYVRWFAIDRQLPTLTFSAVADDGTARPTIEGSAADNVDIARTSLAIDATEVASGTGAGSLRHTVEGLAPGTHTATLAATDAAGNSSTLAQAFRVTAGEGGGQCRNAMTVVLSMNFSMRRPRDRVCWKVWLPTTKVRRVAPEARGHCFVDRKPSVRMWAWDEIGSTGTTRRRDRRGIAACQKRFPNDDGIAYHGLLGKKTHGRLRTWSFDHEPVGSRAKVRLLELYRGKKYPKDSAFPKAEQAWTTKSGGFGAIVNVGSTAADPRVFAAVKRVCRQTKLGFMGLYAGHRYKREWSRRRARIAAILDRCTR